MNVKAPFLPPSKVRDIVLEKNRNYYVTYLEDEKKESKDFTVKDLSADSLAWLKSFQ